MSRHRRRTWLSFVVGWTASFALGNGLACRSPVSPASAPLSTPATAMASTPPPADLVVIRGRVYTLSWAEPGRDGTPDSGAPYDADGWHPDAEAVAVRGDKIVFVGTTSEALRLVGPDTRTIDARGSTVLPGAVDSHMHVASLGRTLSQLDLRGAIGEEETIARVANYAASVPKGTWIFGQGGEEDHWNKTQPTWEALSARVPDHPVLLYGKHGFVVRGNRKAFQLAGITADTPQPDGGTIVKDAAGNLTGMLLNRGASRLLSAKIPHDTREDREQQFRLGLAEMASHGFTAVHEAGVDRLSLEALQALDAAGELPIRVYAMLSGRDAELMAEWAARGPVHQPSGRLEIRGVKAYYDAALGSRGARMLADYSDRPGHRGVAGSEYGFDEAAVSKAMTAGFQVAVHAIGDAGNREVLDFFEKMITQTPALRANRHRIEHAQVIHPDDMPRFSELGVIASMEPPHAVEDKAWAEARLGPDRVRGAYAWRSLRQAQAHLVFNSDLPDGDHSLFYGLYAAITRQDKSGQPVGGWYPEQRMTPEEAVRGYTTWAAYASFTEDDRGALKVGNLADITVVDIDPLTVGASQPHALLSGRATYAIVGGEIVHGSEASPP
ncbi:MAG: amidohydrolase family protein [Myxococcales bacterium FL481]|nr:MAG: amidohydrolase family protein [Myxococcales bacterium FL481]